MHPTLTGMLATARVQELLDSAQPSRRHGERPRPDLAKGLARLLGRVAHLTGTGRSEDRPVGTSLAHHQPGRVAG